MTTHPTIPAGTPLEVEYSLSALVVIEKAYVFMYYDEGQSM